MLTYGSYIWSAYSVAFAIFLINALRARRYYQQAMKQAKGDTNV